MRSVTAELLPDNDHDRAADASVSASLVTTTRNFSTVLLQNLVTGSQGDFPLGACGRQNVAWQLVQDRAMPDNETVQKREIWRPLSSSISLVTQQGAFTRGCQEGIGANPYTATMINKLWSCEPTYKADVVTCAAFHS